MSISIISTASGQSVQESSFKHTLPWRHSDDTPSPAFGPYVASVHEGNYPVSEQTAAIHSICSVKQNKIGPNSYHPSTLVHPADAAYLKIPSQFREYRQPVTEDGDEDTPMRTPPLLAEEDVNMLSEESLLKISQAQSTASKISLPPGYSDRNTPKLSDLGLDKVQTHAVFKQPNYISGESYCPPAIHFGAIVQTHMNFASLPIPAQKRKFWGFDSEELLENGALHCTPCRPSDLVYNPTLTIFKEQNFLDVPQPILEVLKPALALAELIILKGNPRFWVDIACGMRTPDYERMKREGSRAERLIPVGMITSEMKESAMAKLLALGKRLSFKFQSLANTYACASHPHFLPVSRPVSGILNRGELYRSQKAKSILDTQAGDPWDQQATITFDSKLYAVAKSFSLQHYPDAAARLRFNFFFAVNLLHEVSHCFEAKCGHGYYYDLVSKDRSKPGGLSKSYFNRCLEPKYKDYEPEMGAAFEYETFGGRVHPVNHDFSLRYGLNVYFGGSKANPSDLGVKKMHEGQPYGYAVPMSYIEEIQQQTFWERDLNSNGIKIPKTGPRTYLLQTTATQD